MQMYNTDQIAPENEQHNKNQITGTTQGHTTQRGLCDQVKKPTEKTLICLQS